jgi:hypothetical protein
MEPLIIKKTRSSLAVHFDPDSGVLRMQGESYPENAGKFFEPVLGWLEAYLQQADQDAQVAMDMDIVYFNSSSSKALMDLFILLEDAGAAGKRVSVTWRYHPENEIAQECGEEFAEDCASVRFHLAPYETE